MTAMTELAAPAAGLRGRLRALRSSARLKLTLAFVAVATAAGLLVVLSVRTVLLDQLEERTRDDIVQEYAEFTRFLELGRDERGRRVDGDLAGAGEKYLQRTVLARGEVVIVIDEGFGVVQSLPVNGVRLGDDPRLLERWRSSEKSRVESIATAAGDALVLSVPVLREDRRAGTFVVAQFFAGERREVNDALEVLVLATVASVLLAALGSWWLAGWLLRPLRTMSDTARQITDQDLTRRLEDTGGRDEIATLARTFNSMLDRLEGALDSQRTFLADAAHDLRTPLTIVRGNVEQLRDGLVPEAEREEALALVVDEVTRMARLVDDLVLLARSQRPDFLRLAPVDLGDLAHGVVRRAQSIPGPSWRVSAGYGVVTADADRLTQALLNLVDNAARYSPAGAPVEIGTGIARDRAWLWVADEGPGVPPEERERIFSRHVRGPDRLATGSGLGLAIARAIAEAHGGTLLLDTGRARGARFVITIPLDQAGGEA